MLKKSLLIAAALVVVAGVLYYATNYDLETVVVNTSSEREAVGIAQKIISLESQEMPAVTAFEGGFIWVVDRRSAVITKVDPETNEVVDEIDLGPALGRRLSPWDLTAGGGSLWMTEPRHRRIFEVDPASGKVVSTRRTRGYTSDVEFAAGYLWYSDDATRTDDPTKVRGVLTQVDPASGEVEATYPLGKENGVLDLVEMDGIVWMVTDAARYIAGTGPNPTFHVSSELWKINPRLGRVLQKSPLGSTLTRGAVNPVIGDVEVDGDALWLSWVNEQIVAKLDPHTGLVEQKILMEEFDFAPEIAIADGYVWVANINDSEIAKVDPESRDREIVRVDGDVSHMGTGAGSVWVPLYGLVHRDPGERPVSAAKLIRLDSSS